MATDSSAPPAEAALPTLSRLGNPKVPEDVDPVKVAAEWVSSFSKAAEQGDVAGVLDTLVDSDFVSGLLKPNPSPPTTGVSLYWRDHLALTWDFRTFESTPVVGAFLHDRLGEAKITNVKLRADLPPTFDRTFPDTVWIQLFFTFETSLGICSGITRLVPLALPKAGDTIAWKAHMLFTNLEDLKGFPEKAGPLRSPEPNHGKWEEQRRKEAAFEEKDPSVLVIGAGHSGLGVAARLKTLDVSTLVVDKNERVGDNWRSRYEALCLHDPVWYDHMPYIPFPSTWPVFTPAKKLANWLEHYAEAMELNVWTSTTVTQARQDPQTQLWSVTVKKANGSERVFKVKHVVMAVGLKGGKGYIPEYPGMDKFKGQILHSTVHHSAKDHIGKKVVVIGACTSGHDICVDYVDHGVDVTMFQRSSTYVMSTKKGVPLLLGAFFSEGGPPTEIADRLNASFPTMIMAGVASRVTKLIAQEDKEILDGLHKVGFRTNNGYKDCGLFLSVWERGGGYYMDVGASKYIIDRKIKIKNDSQIKELTETGIKFENGSELEADVIVYCTGLDDPKYTIRSIFGDEVAENTIPIWGLNGEGEIKGLWKEIYPGLFNMMGNLAICRFYSKHLALQIKAKEEGLFDAQKDRYAAKA